MDTQGYVLCSLYTVLFAFNKLGIVSNLLPVVCRGIQFCVMSLPPTFARLVLIAMCRVKFKYSIK